MGRQDVDASKAEFPETTATRATFMQPNSPRHNYILAEVATATPQKLQLLLIEAAMKNVHRTKLLWQEQKYDVAIDSLIKAQDIVAEILCSFDKENFPDLAKKLASIYVFIFRRLAEASMSHDPAKLDDALRVLATERETWQMVCEKFGASTTESKTPDAADLGRSASWSSAKPLDGGSPANASARLDLSSGAGENKGTVPGNPAPPIPPRALPGKAFPTADAAPPLNNGLGGQSSWSG